MGHDKKGLVRVSENHSEPVKISQNLDQNQLESVRVSQNGSESTSEPIRLVQNHSTYVKISQTQS